MRNPPIKNWHNDKISLNVAEKPEEVGEPVAELPQVEAEIEEAEVSPTPPPEGVTPPTEVEGVREPVGEGKEPLKVFRGEADVREPDSRRIEGILSTTTNLTTAKIFTGEKGKIAEYVIDPKAKIVKVEDITKELLKTMPREKISADDWYDYARRNNIDVIDKRGVKF